MSFTTVRPNAALIHAGWSSTWRSGMTCLTWGRRNLTPWSTSTRMAPPSDPSQVGKFFGWDHERERWRLEVGRRYPVTNTGRKVVPNTIQPSLAWFQYILRSAMHGTDSTNATPNPFFFPCVSFAGRVVSRLRCRSTSRQGSGLGSRQHQRSRDPARRRLLETQQTRLPVCRLQVHLHSHPPPLVRILSHELKAVKSRKTIFWTNGTVLFLFPFRSFSFARLACVWPHCHPLQHGCTRFSASQTLSLPRRKVAFLGLGRKLTGSDTGAHNGTILSGIHAIEYDHEEPNFVYKCATLTRSLFYFKNLTEIAKSMLSTNLHKHIAFFFFYLLQQKILGRQCFHCDGHAPGSARARLRQRPDHVPARRQKALQQTRRLGVQRQSPPQLGQ